MVNWCIIRSKFVILMREILSKLASYHTECSLCHTIIGQAILRGESALPDREVCTVPYCAALVKEYVTTRS